MGNNAQHYRYNGLVVEVRRIADAERGNGRFQCLVRGFGHGNTAPRMTCFINAETNAIAARKALQMYNEQNGQEKH